MNTARPLQADTPVTLNGYKVPLTPIKDGFGYYGTIAYDKETKTYTQCFICGSFYKGLAHHVRNSHNKEPKLYKIAYGLPQSISLAAPAQKKIYRDSQSTKVRAKSLALAQANPVRSTSSRISLHQKNLEGRCPDQLADKFLRLKEKLHHQPTRKQMVKEYGWGVVKSIRTTFGNYGELTKELEKIDG